MPPVHTSPAGPGETQGDSIARHVWTEGDTPPLPLQNLQGLRLQTEGWQKLWSWQCGRTGQRWTAGAQGRRPQRCLSVQVAPTAWPSPQPSPLRDGASEAQSPGRLPRVLRRGVRVPSQTLYPNRCCDCGKPHQIEHGPPKLRPSWLCCGLKVPFPVHSCPGDFGPWAGLCGPPRLSGQCPTGSGQVPLMP